MNRIINKNKIILLFIFLNYSIDACVCARQPLIEQYQNASFIFVGKAINVLDINYQISCKFKIIKMFKGANLEHLIVHTGLGGGDCGYNFEFGETYLVYAFKSKHGKIKFKTDICTRTCKLKDAQVDLEFLKHLPQSKLSTSILGRITLYKDNTFNPLLLPPCKGFNFVLKNEKVQYSITTNSDGIYYLDNIKPGIYQIYIDKKLNLSIKEDDPEEIKINESKANEYNIVLTNVN